MNSDIKERLLTAARRVLRSEIELQAAKAEWDEVCSQATGDITVRPVVAEESPISQGLEGGKSIRRRIEEFLKANAGRPIRGRKIAETLGTKLTTTRFVLYELQKAGIIEKPDVDQWTWKGNENGTQPEIPNSSPQAQPEPKRNEDSAFVPRPGVVPH